MSIQDYLYGDVNQALDTIRTANEKKDADLERLREENRKLRKEYSKDAEIQKLKEEIDTLKKDMRRGFPITEEQMKKVKEWMTKHEESHGWKTLEDRLAAKGACGGLYEYRFLGTSLGVSGVVRCTCCGAEFEFQEIG